MKFIGVEGGEEESKAIFVFGQDRELRVTKEEINERLTDIVNSGQIHSEWYKPYIAEYIHAKEVLESIDKDTL